eukprot:scaffold208251_cov30-Tisochrysis_lutea.AAC.8
MFAGGGEKKIGWEREERNIAREKREQMGKRRSREDLPGGKGITILYEEESRMARARREREREQSVLLPTLSTILLPYE